MSVISTLGTRRCFFMSWAMNRFAAFASGLDWTRVSSRYLAWSTALHSCCRTLLIYEHLVKVPSAGDLNPLYDTAAPAPTHAICWPRTP
ncbi:hypothetical protein [Streptomyces sp. NPDC093261]|uniref:hypothetical protein n=1 Tax=Streptomyces sp. NPDC093261 TaxID=3366037 RepID=UPI00382E34C4